MARSVVNGKSQDIRVLHQLRRIIEGDGCVPRPDIDVDVENGVVELLGVIPNKREHDALLTLVQGACGTRQVIDHLIVRSWPR